jgi:sulfonate transport system permease protein
MADMTQDSVLLVRRRPRVAAQGMAARRRRRAYARMALGIGVPVLLLGIWQLAAELKWIDTRIYPAPSTCIKAIHSLYTEGFLQSDTEETLTTMLLGYAYGSAVGFVVGVVMGMSRWWRAALEPLLRALYVVPTLALLPVFLAIFGLADGPVIALVAVTVFFFVWITTMEAVAGVPDGYLEAGRSLDMSRPKIFVHVLLPAALPSIFVGLRVAMGVAVLVIVGTEFVVGSSGLGYLIYNAGQLFIMQDAYAGILVVAVLGVLLAVAVELIGRALTPWERGRRSAARQ